MGRSCSRPQIHQFSPSWASLPHETLRNLPAWVQEANLCLGQARRYGKLGAGFIVPTSSSSACIYIT